MDDAGTPYAALTPDVVLDALDSAGFAGDGRLLALNSYENRVYRAHLADGAVVVAKFYRPGRWSDAAILEEHAFAAELAAAEVPVVAPLALQSNRLLGATLATHQHFRFSVYPSRPGRSPELEQSDTLRWIGRFIGRMHAIGARTAFEHREMLEVRTFGEEPRAYVLASGLLPPDLAGPYRVAADMAIERVQACFRAVGHVPAIRLHGDCHAGNILWNEPRPGAGQAGPHFVDLDDARTGPAIQDLWMLLSGERSEMARQLDAVLEGYREFRDFDVREVALIEALRTLRLIHYAAWIARRWDDPAFPRAFPFFETQRYWQDRVLELREQIAAMDEPPLDVG